MRRIERGLTRLERIELDQLRRARDGAEPFAAFVKRVAPAFYPVPPHLRRLYRLIQESRVRQVFATVSMPPRHGKTTSFALALAWRTLYDPACLNFYATYAGDRSDNVGRSVQRLVQRLGVPLDRAARSVDDWRTSFGGGLKSTSVNGQITGEGANGGLIICDDLLKGRKESRSRTTREDTFGFLRTDVMSRIEGGASLIVMNTRWHDEDPIGQLLRNPMGYPFEHVNMPAVHDGRFRAIDERLHPEQARPLWLDVDNASPQDVEAAMRWYALCRARGEGDWWSLYEGMPRSEGMEIFNDHPGRYTLPHDFAGWRMCIALDPACTETTLGDYSAIGVIAMKGRGRDAQAAVVRAAKYQVTMPQIARVAVEWQRKYRLPCIVEGVSGFKGVIQMMKELEPGIDVKPARMFGDKVTRSARAAQLWNTGNLLVPAGIDQNGNAIDVGWDVADLVRVVHSFTGMDDAEDDLTDMVAHGVNELNGTDAVPGESVVVGARERFDIRTLNVSSVVLNPLAERPEVDADIPDDLD